MSVIVPVCPAPEPRVCAVVDGPVILKSAADAPDSAKRAKAAMAPVWMRRFFIGGMVRKEMMGAGLRPRERNQPAARMMTAVYDCDMSGQKGRKEARPFASELGAEPIGRLSRRAHRPPSGRVARDRDPAGANSTDDEDSWGPR